MAQEIRRYISERRDKKELALLKEKPKKNKGGINTRMFSVAESILGRTHEPLKLLAKQKKDKDQSALEFQQSKYQKLLTLLVDHQFTNSVMDIKSEYHETRQILDQEHEPCEWMNQWAEKARDITFATHVAKLTHSSSKSSSIYDKTTASDSAYLTTNTLKDLNIDTATSNAASAPAGEILTLQVNNKSLLDYIKVNDRTAFEKLTENQDDISYWMSSFKQAYDSERKTSHFLSKQVYFPIEDGKHHLLLPLASSSIAHALFFKFKELSSDENKVVKEQKSKNKFYEKGVTYYPNQASLTLTRSIKAHSNVSSLNKDRYGILTLIPCNPPKWKSGNLLPLKQTTLFDRQLRFKLNKEIENLQRLLLVIKSKGAAIKNPSLHRALANDINEIAQGLFIEVIRINLLSDEKGWTQNCSLPLSQQLLLEPYRDDDVAIQEKIKKQWQAEIENDFSYWLNQKLKHKKLNLTPIQQRLWKDLFSQPLREFIAAQELSL